MSVSVCVATDDTNPCPEKKHAVPSGVLPCIKYSEFFLNIYVLLLWGPYWGIDVEDEGIVIGFGGYIFSPEPHMFNCKIYMLHNILFHKIFYFCFRKKYMSFHIAHILARIAL